MNVKTLDQDTLNFCLRHKDDSHNGRIYWNGIRLRADGKRGWHYWEPIYFTRAEIHYDMNPWSQTPDAHICWFFKIPDTRMIAWPDGKCLSQTDYETNVWAAAEAERRGYWHYESYNSTLYFDDKLRCCKYSWPELVMQAALECGATLDSNDVEFCGWEDYKGDNPICLELQFMRMQQKQIRGWA